MILHGIEYQRPTSLNMRILADHVTYSFLAFMKSIFHFCLGCYCRGYSQNGRSNLSSLYLTFKQASSQKNGPLGHVSLLGSQCVGCYPGILSTNQVSATALKIRHPWMVSTPTTSKPTTVLTPQALLPLANNHFRSGGKHAFQILYRYTSMCTWIHHYQLSKVKMTALMGYHKMPIISIRSPDSHWSSHSGISSIMSSGVLRPVRFSTISGA